MVTLVRSILSLPDVLLIHEIGGIDEKRGATLQAVLSRFVAGADVAGLSRVEGVDGEDGEASRSDKSGGAARRTVVWTAPEPVLVATGVSSLLELTKDHELRAVPSAAGA